MARTVLLKMDMERLTKKSQSALEFLTIVGIGLALILISSFFGVDYITSYSDNINTINAQQLTYNAVSSANLVYVQGNGSQVVSSVTMPSGLILNRTYISGNEINLRFFSMNKYRDIYQDAVVNLTGSIPTQQGTFNLYVKMVSNRQAILFINAPVSYILFKTFNDTTRINPCTNFTNGTVNGTVYYSVYLYNFSGSSVDSGITVRYYKPDGTQNGSDMSASTTGGIYNGSFIVPSGNTGAWIISVVENSSSILGTAMFNKY